VFFDCRKGFVADIVFNFTGVLCGNGLINAETYQKLRKQSMPFIDFFGNFLSGVGQSKITVAVGNDIPSGF
jgi:hypothetical protein